MPKSRGRKPNKHRPPSRRGDEGGYQPGVIEIDEHQAVEGLMRLGPEQLLEVGLPVWWLVLLPGQPANMCLDGALVLREAFAQFGVVAEPKPVTLIVHDQRTGRSTRFGTEVPRFDGEYFVGHMGLWLPQSGRFVDHTVQQFPAVRHEGWLPVVVPAHGLTWGAARVGVPRGRLLLEYTPLPDNTNQELLDEAERRVPERHHRAGVNLASNFLELLRSDELLRDRAVTAPHPRLCRLLELVGEAPTWRDEDHNVRFMVPGTKGVYLDEISDDQVSPGRSQRCRRADRASSIGE